MFSGGATIELFFLPLNIVFLKTFFCLFLVDTELVVILRKSLALSLPETLG